MKPNNHSRPSNHPDSQTPLPTKRKSGATPKATKPSTAQNHLLDMISPIPAGLTIVALQEVSLLAYVRNAIEQEAREESNKLGVHMPIVYGMLSMYAGNYHQLDQARVIAAANISTANEVPHEFETYGSRDGFDWCSDEGLCTLEPIIRDSEGWWVTLEQAIAIPVTSTIASGLFRIRNAAQQADVSVMLFLVCPKGYESSRIHELCDEYIEVTECDPGPETDIAFSIDCVGLRHLNKLGIGKTMCSVTVHNGTFQRRFEPYISNNLATRVLWMLRGQGKTLEEIGSILGTNKSTVSRHLQGLPPPRKLKMENDWLARHLELLSLGNSTAETTSEDEEEVGEVEDWED